MPMSLPDGVASPGGKEVRGGTTPTPNSVGIVKWTNQGIARTWRIGANPKWDTYAKGEILS